ncbi:MAG: LPD25 domain-containing protein, partial [Butyrivibrio hungatei]|nr:LPD25 domain-containing protein [Butyrivibrio hungatei]
FPSENKVYTVKEFNELILQADKEFHNRKEYAEKKYGSADNYWDLENEGKLPEEDKGIQFGYDKTNFKFFNIPNPENPEDTFSYEPSRYDIGDGNGSVFDYVRSTCSHDEFIEALNQLEKDLYFPEVTKTQREDIDKIVAKEAKKLSKNLTEKMAAVDEAQEEYKELHKKWLIESSEAEATDKKLEDALSGVKAVYDKAMSDAFGKILNEYPYASIKSIEDSQLLQYAANEVKKMAVNELYLPSRNAQKAMNAEDYASYNSTDWAKLRKIWALFPANVNMDSYARDLLNKTIEQRNEKANARPAEEVHDEKKPSTELTVEDLEICKKVIPPSQYNFTLELTKGEEGDFYKGKLKEIAETYRKINTDNELINEDGTHNVGFRYFLGNTEIYISEIDSEGIGFGYNILNGDLQMSEWGSTSMDEILSIPFIEMDYHIDKDTTIEEMLYKGHPEYFKEFAPKAEEKPYNFFINDAANLDLGIGAEIEPITGLSAEEAAVKYAELKSKGLSPYIGINIPGDFIFDDKEGQGAGIFTEINGHSSFYMGDNFVKDLKKNDEHARNVLAAYKELYDMTDKYITGVEKPNFLFDKIEELGKINVAETSNEA